MDQEGLEGLDSFTLARIAWIGAKRGAVMPPTTPPPAPTPRGLQEADQARAFQAAWEAGWQAGRSAGWQQGIPSCACVRHQRAAGRGHGTIPAAGRVGGRPGQALLAVREGLVPLWGGSATVPDGGLEMGGYLEVWTPAGSSSPWRAGG
jgi:hypothetical protein